MRKSSHRKGVSERKPPPFDPGDEGIDLSDIPELDEAWFARAVVRTTPAKQAISLRVDQHVLDFFKGLGKGYQTQMNAVLRAYVDHARRAAKASAGSKVTPTRKPRRYSP